MMWSHKAFGIYMGDVMTPERDAARDPDVMLRAVARGQAIERAEQCAAETAPRASRWASTTRTGRAGRTEVARS